MSRRQNTIRVGLEKKRSSTRPVLESLEIPQNPSQITICSQPRPCLQPEAPHSGNLSVTSSYKELFCTTQTCSNSQSCIQTSPDLCPHGLKDVKNEDQCSETCHNHVTKRSNTKLETTYNSSYNRESRPSCPAAVSISTVRQSSSLARLLSSCCSVNKSDASPDDTPQKSPSTSSYRAPPTRPNLPEKQPCVRREPSVNKLPPFSSTPLRTNMPENKKKNTIDKVSPSNSPIRRTIVSAKINGAEKQFATKDTPVNKFSTTAAQVRSSQTPTETATKPIRGENPDQQYDDTLTDMASGQMSCCEESDAIIRARNASRPVDAGTNPKPCTAAASTDTNDTSPNKLQRCGNVKYATDLIKRLEEETKTPSSGSPSPEEHTSCCPSPQPASSVTDCRKKSGVRTSFKLPEAKFEPDPKPSEKVSSIKEVVDREVLKQKKDPCSCADIKSPPPVQKKTCTCHFPPAFNQYGCTGNISGNCNCSSGQSE